MKFLSLVLALILMAVLFPELNHVHEDSGEQHHHCMTHCQQHVWVEEAVPSDTTAVQYATEELVAFQDHSVIQHLWVRPIDRPPQFLS